MDLTTRLELARRSYDLRAILGARKKVVICPLPQHKHGNYSPSFSIFTHNGVQFFKCFGNCGLYGDVVDFMGYMYVPNYNPRRNKDREAALDLLENKATISPPKPEKIVRLSQNEWSRYLPIGETGLKYALSRGLTEETVIKFNIGQKDHFITIPVFQEGDLIGIKMRNLLPGGTRYMSMKGSRQGIFNYDEVFMASGTVLITKAEIPTMLLDQMGYQACAPTGGEGAIEMIDKLKNILQFARRIVIGDNDETGKRLGEARAKALEAELVFAPTLFKDVDEFIVAYPNEAKGWLESIVC